jgi:predicted nucleic acid-binding protein
MPVLYIDTNIFINIIKAEKNPFGKDLAKPAANLFWQAVSCKHRIIISDWTLEELLKHLDATQLTMSFALLKPKLKAVGYSAAEEEEAKTKDPEHFQDQLHTLIAEREKVEVIVTRNTTDFEKRTKIPVKKPEQV